MLFLCLNFFDNLYTSVKSNVNSNNFFLMYRKNENKKLVKINENFSYTH